MGRWATHWYIINPATKGENFAEKWNRKPGRAEAFFAWHSRALDDLEALGRTGGAGSGSAGRWKGCSAPGPVGGVFAAQDDALSAARRTGRLTVARDVGLTAVASPALAATPVRHNTFYGR